MAWEERKKYPQMSRSGRQNGMYGTKGWFSWRNTSGLRPRKKGEYKRTKETVEKWRKKMVGRPSKLKGVPRLKYRGENASNWRGGTTGQSRLERVRFKTLVQKKIFERDGYTCQLCQQHGVNLQVDHIKSWARYPDLRFVLTNCRTVCKKCHYMITFKKPMVFDKPWGHNLKFYQLEKR